MASANDFVGMNCPFCHAVDSLEADDVRGEVACTECAKVVAMGLEENALTRFSKDATMEDVDRYSGDVGSPSSSLFGSAAAASRAAASSSLSRVSAAAIAAGVVVGSMAGSALGSSGGGSAQYARPTLHQKMRQHMEALARMSRRGDDVIARAVAVAKHFVGYRRERGLKLDQQRETAAACFLIATEMCEQPVPLGELRTLDPSLKDVETRRREIVVDTGMEVEEARLRAAFVPHLIRQYIRMLHLQMVRYETACLALYKAITVVAARGSATKELAQTVDAERVVAAVLLARAERQIIWEGKPVYDAANEPPDTTLFDGFAAIAHLQTSRVQAIMQAVHKELSRVREEFEKIMAEETKKSTSEAGQRNVSVTAGVKREREK